MRWPGSRSRSLSRCGGWQEGRPYAPRVLCDTVLVSPTSPPLPPVTKCHHVIITLTLMSSHIVTWHTVTQCRHDHSHTMSPWQQSHNVAMMAAYVCHIMSPRHGTTHCHTILPFYHHTLSHNVNIMPCHIMSPSQLVTQCDHKISGLHGNRRC